MNACFLSVAVNTTRMVNTLISSPIFAYYGGMAHGTQTLCIQIQRYIIIIIIMSFV
jgi:hypothetical protein